MDRRRRAGVIAASGGAISASTAGLSATHHGTTFAGLDSDFWMGCAVGILLGLALLALLYVVRGRSLCQLP